MEPNCDGTTGFVPENITCVFKGCKSTFASRKHANFHIRNARCSQGQNIKKSNPEKFASMVKAYEDSATRTKEEKKKCYICKKKFSRAADCKRHKRTCQSHQVEKEGKKQPKKKAEIHYEVLPEVCPKCMKKYLPIREHAEEHNCDFGPNYLELRKHFCQVCQLFVLNDQYHVERHEAGPEHKKKSGLLPIFQVRFKPKLVLPKNEEEKNERGKEERKKQEKMVKCEECLKFYGKRRHYEHIHSVRHVVEAKERRVNALRYELKDFVVKWKEKKAKEKAKKKKNPKDPHPIPKFVKCDPNKLTAVERGKANSSPFKCTAVGFKNFLRWRKGTGNIDPEATDVRDILKRSKAGPMKVDFAAPVKRKRKAFEGWASAVTPNKITIKKVVLDKEIPALIV